MNWICALRWSAVAIAYMLSSTFLFMVGYGLGRQSAIRKHWKMLHRVGSRFANGEDN